MIVNQVFGHSTVNQQQFLNFHRLFVQIKALFEDLPPAGSSGSSVLVSETHRVLHDSRLITLLLETIHTVLFSFHD